MSIPLEKWTALIDTEFKTTYMDKHNRSVWQLVAAVRPNLQSIAVWDTLYFWHNYIVDGRDVIENEGGQREGMIYKGP